MASCSTCGKSLPAFSFGQDSDRCQDCREGHSQSSLPGPSGERPAVANRRPSVAQLARLFPVTAGIVGLNIAAFLVMVFSGVSPSTPTSEQLLKWGANSGLLTLSGQPWRLFTSTFIHIGIFHIAFNMWCLWDLGQLAERIFHRWSYVGIYLLSGVAGSIASVWRHPLGISAGASGAIFGVAGALITALYLGKLPVPKPALMRTLKSLLFFAGFNLLIGQAIAGIDNSAHLGGLVTGLSLGATLAVTLTGPREIRHRVRLVTFSAAALILAGAFILVLRANAYVVELSSGSEALDAGNIKVAIEKLGAATTKKPDFAPAFAMLGNAYLRNHETSAAQAALQRSLQLDPKSTYAKYNMGLVYMRTGRFGQAKDVFSELVRLNGKDTRSLLLLGATLDEMEKHVEAVATLKRAAQIEPHNPEIHGYLGSAQLSAKQYDDAIASFQEALRLKVDYKGAELGLAAAYKAKGLDSQAAAAQERAAAMPDSPEDP
jgi:membrane associated rhomboid family serine protease/Flp pilus assembly protein TadD